MFQQLVGTVLPGQGGDGSTWECMALGCRASGMSSVHVCLWLRRRLGAIGYEGPTVWADKMGPDVILDLWAVALRLCCPTTLWAPVCVP